MRPLKQRNAVIILIASFIFYWYTNLKRVEVGYYPSDAVLDAAKMSDITFWMTLNTVAYVIFLASMTGTLVAYLTNGSNKKG